MGVVHERRRSRHSPDARTVEDLLSAQRYHIDVPADAFARPTSAIHPLPEPPGKTSKTTEGEHRRPESTWSKVAKLAGLTTATSLLVGAVVASSVLTRERSEAATRANPAPPQITGAAALGGFVPEGSTASSSSAESSPHPSTAGTSSPQGAARQSVDAGNAAPAAPAPTSAPTNTATTGDKVALVERFYHRMIHDPESALAMLAPGLAGDEPGDLIRAWSSMREIRVDDVEVQADGAVRAVVTMVQRDGTTLRVTQLLELAGTSGELITRAVLLSAEEL